MARLGAEMPICRWESELCSQVLVFAPEELRKDREVRTPVREALLAWGLARPYFDQVVLAAVRQNGKE